MQQHAGLHLSYQAPAPFLDLMGNNAPKPAQIGSVSAVICAEVIDFIAG